MSIYIKGMKMPTACFACKMLYEPYWECRVHGDANHSTECRPTNCPLIEVPNHHGRLIDESEFFARLDDGIKTISSLALPEDFVAVYTQLVKEVKEEIGKCRTIIPAEEG